MEGGGEKWNCDDHVLALKCDHCFLDGVRRFDLDPRRVLNEAFTEKKSGSSTALTVCVLMLPCCRQKILRRNLLDGMEVTFQMNHLAPFLLVNLVQDVINPCGRIILTTSDLYCRYKHSFAGMVEEDQSFV